jgi:hypothetical protein
MTHPDPIRLSSGVSRPERQTSAAEQCAALLFAEALKPLAAALGFYGDAVVLAAAQAAARSERDGLRGMFERALAGER